MEPRQVGSGGGFEKIPAQSGEIQAAPDVERANFGPENSPEGHPVDTGNLGVDASQIAIPALPAPIVLPDDNQNPDGLVDDVSLVAKDDDLIEKEWVDKAKKIISETKDDPLSREREIGKLQLEYVRKRYGRKIGGAEE